MAKAQTTTVDEASAAEELQVLDEQLGTTPFQLRQRILDTPDQPPIEELYLDEWGFKVYVRGMTSAQRDKWEGSQVSVGKGGSVEYNADNLRASLVARCLCTPQGDPVMKQDDVGRLGQKSATAIDKIYEVAKRLSGISQKDVAALEGKLGKDTSGDGW